MTKHSPSINCTHRSKMSSGSILEETVWIIEDQTCGMMCPIPMFILEDAITI